MTLDLPTQYKPYSKVIIGTNKLFNVTALATVGNNIPILIGKGSTPRVWLSIPMDQKGESWYPLIKDNFATHPDIKVTAKTGAIFVYANDKVVLSALRPNEDALTILKLDLRPFGLNMYSDESFLQVMGNKLSKNEFRNVGTVIGIGTNT